MQFMIPEKFDHLIMSCYVSWELSV